MKKYSLRNSVLGVAALWSVAILPLAVPAQTRVSLPKNKYKVQDDVKIGRQASVEVERQFPLVNDAQVQQYVERVGARLVASIPPQFQQSAFDYNFKVVNARDINAFALPGGPMYVNRGMIEAARNEGEMAGVMAHEITHVALRHATAQATKQNSFGSQLGRAGLILGGAILGGQTGAQLGALTAQAWMTKYSREYETQADILGSQIMANAGYDPRDLANMFQTISRQSGGGRGPEWLSSHPDPGNRYQNINREAEMLRVSSNPIKVTSEFERVQARLRGMPATRTMAQLQEDYTRGRRPANRPTGPVSSPTSNGRYSDSIEYPSTRYRAYDSTGLTLSVPSNWREFDAGTNLTFAPEGAFGDQGITHGVMIGIYESSGSNFANATQDYISSLLQSNNYLSQQGNFTRATVAGRQGYRTTLLGRSPVTGRDEAVTVYTAPLPNGDLLYVAAVSPESESYRYSTAFRNLIGSIRLNG